MEKKFTIKLVKTRLSAVKNYFLKFHSVLLRYQKFKNSSTKRFGKLYEKLV